jgi:Beta-propeller repeat
MADVSIQMAGACSFLCSLLGLIAEAQTTCGLQHANPGVYICYPDPASSPEDAVIPGVFHFSAQVNAPTGEIVVHFRVLLDDQVVYDNRAVPPVQKLSLETNLNSPFPSGTHTLQFVVDGVGTAEVKGLQIAIPTNSTFCDPTARTNRHTCRPSKRPPLQWSLGESGHTATHPLDEYRSILDLYARNVKALEADNSDAVAVDDDGNLYVASHIFTDVELRKYTSRGSIVYDTLIRSCGDGFLSVAGLAIDDSGRAWIAANTTACFRGTADAFNSGGGESKGTRGIVICLDTAKPSAIGPLYVTYLSDVDYQLTGIRVDGEDNAYLAGTTESPDYPHESSLSIIDDSDKTESTRLGFVSALNSSGSNLLWSALLRGTGLNALALDGKGNVYLTGRAVSRQTNAAVRRKNERAAAATTCVRGKASSACDDMLVAEITDHGRQLHYLAQLGGSEDEEGRAISVDPQGDWIFITGDTNSSDFPASREIVTSRRDGQQSMVIALQPCKTGILDVYFISDSAGVPSLALPVALDAFASVFPQRSRPPQPATSAQKPLLSIQRAPSCSSNR